MPPIRHVARLDCRLDPGPWSYALSHGPAIDKAWAAWTAENPALFDGRVLAVTSFGFDGETFSARYAETRYRAFLYFLREGPAAPDARNGFALAALTSAEGHLVMGVMGAHTANAGRIYFPGGTPDPSDVTEGRIDLGGSVRRELAEETGLDPAALCFDPGYWLVEDDKRLGFMAVARSTLGSEALQAQIRAHLDTEAEPELAGTHVVREAADLRPDLMPDFQLRYARWWLDEGRSLSRK